MVHCTTSAHFQKMSDPMRFPCIHYSFDSSRFLRMLEKFTGWSFFQAFSRINFNIGTAFAKN